MVFSTGCDIVEIKRIEKAIKSKKFTERIYTENELLLSKKAETLAGFFAAKEAVAKGFGTGFDGFSPNEVEIVKNKMGKPEVVLHKNALKTAQSLNISKIHISVSHSKENAIAIAILEKNR